MSLLHDVALQRLFGGLIVLLILATVVGRLIARRTRDERAMATVRNLNARIKAWWVMSVVFAIAVLVGPIGSVVLFALLSFLALREFITLVPTRPSDHRALLWSFFLITPLQYVLVALHWYGLFSILIPVYAFLFLALRIAISGDTAHFLERVSAIQWALMICVYSLSYAPALLGLGIRGYGTPGPTLLLFLVIVVQGSDVLQYIFGKLFGHRKIAPLVSPSKTVEGFLGGVASATLLGALIWWATPFTFWQAGLQALIIALTGFGGGLVMSAVKRDRGVKDFGTIIAGHGGILDRVDSLTFAAPIFFHTTRFFFGS
jgi:phosphatidate cytidylyltransferase